MLESRLNYLKPLIRAVQAFVARLKVESARLNLV